MLIRYSFTTKMKDLCNKVTKYSIHNSVGSLEYETYQDLSLFPKVVLQMPNKLYSIATPYLLMEMENIKGKAAHML